jgi:hypothetical protein
MKRSFSAVILAATIGLVLTIQPLQVANGLGPQLQVDCGNWNTFKDAKGTYRELSASALYEFSGASFTYNIKFYGSARDYRNEISRAVINWRHEITNPEYSSRAMEVPITTTFRNNKYEAYMFKTKYIRADILFTDAQGFEARKACIWKWK